MYLFHSRGIAGLGRVFSVSCIELGNRGESMLAPTTEKPVFLIHSAKVALAEAIHAAPPANERESIQIKLDRSGPYDGNVHLTPAEISYVRSSLLQSARTNNPFGDDQRRADTGMGLLESIAQQMGNGGVSAESHS